jgi:DNA-binding transcriptional LysR family regulator
MPQQHALARRRRIEPADLAGQRLISSPEDSPYGQVLRRAYGKRRDALRIEVEVRSATAACWFVRAGAGVAVVDAASIAGTAAEGLVVRPFHSAETLEVALLHNRQFPLSVIEAAFVESFDEAWRRIVAQPRAAKAGDRQERRWRDPAAAA